MDPNKTALERAFELAKSGRYQTVADVRRAVSSEGYAQQQISGPALARQLRKLIVLAVSAGS